MVNSFFGLDRPLVLPPNIIMTGALTLSDSSVEKPFDSELQLWLEEQKANRKDIVYITFGSMLTLKEDFIENFYKGLKLTNYSFIWSLKKGKLPQ